MRERTRRPPALGCALASRIQAAMTVAHVTTFLFACVSWLVPALPMPAAAADPCPLLRAKAGSPDVAPRLSAAAWDPKSIGLGTPCQYVSGSAVALISTNTNRIILVILRPSTIH